MAQESILAAQESILVAQESISGLVRSSPVVDIRAVVEVRSGLVVEFSGPVRSGLVRSSPDFDVPVLIIPVFPVRSS